MTGSFMLGGWGSEVAALEAASPGLNIPKSARQLASRTRLVSTKEEAEALVEDLSRLRLGAIAIDTEYRFNSIVTTSERSKDWVDLRSVVPLILSGAAWVPEDNIVIRFMLDLRLREVWASVEQLLRLHVPFVAHNIKAELQVFWAMGLDPVLPQSWCTYVAERALSLGRNDIKLGLEKLCSNYGIIHPFAASKSALQQSFLVHPMEQPFTDQQVQYALSDAETTLHLYVAQQEPVLNAGLHSQLMSVEFPFAQANARMEWDGVYVDPNTTEELRFGLTRALDHHAAVLAEAGLTNPNSPRQVIAFLTERGHGPRLVRNGSLSTSDDVLQGLEGIEPMATEIQRCRQYALGRVSSTPWGATRR